MAYLWQKLLSQNFLREPGLVDSLVLASSIGKADTVLEIGAGKGIITKILAGKARYVVAFELDKQLYGQLVNKFNGVHNVDLHNEDFLLVSLPHEPYKIFSNIPFRLTGEIIQKLLRSSNPPEDAYLIVQREAAKKLIGDSLVSVLYQPFFEFSIKYEFRPADFIPVPRVHIVLLRIQKRLSPLISNTNKEIYEDFVTYIFSRKKPYVIHLPTDPTNLGINNWLKLFENFLSGQNRAQLGRIKGSAKRLFAEQQKLEKIHRTRNDKNWKKFTEQP